MEMNSARASQKKPHHTVIMCDFWCSATSCLSYVQQQQKSRLCPDHLQVNMLEMWWGSEMAAIEYTKIKDIIFIALLVTASLSGVQQHYDSEAIVGCSDEVSDVEVEDTRFGLAE
jgi:hypothetical protein